jgi:glycine oxidase
MSTTRDAVIVGGGVTGLACAAALAGAGLRVSLVDPEPAPGAGASGVPSALLTPPVGRLAEKPLGQLASASFARYANWCAGLAERTGISPAYMQSGSLRLYTERPRKLRPSQEWIDAESLAAIEPTVSGAHIAGAIRSVAAAHINPRGLLSALEASIRLDGGDLVRCSASNLLTSGDRVTGVRLADGTTVKAEAVIIAAGLHSRSLLALIGADLPLVADAGMVIQMAGMPDLRHILLVGEYGMVGKGNGLVWVKGVHLPAEGDAYDAHRAKAELSTVAADILGARGQLVVAWEGVRPRAANGIPFIGPMPRWQGLMVATGHGSNGFLLAPLTAEAVMTWVGGARPEEATICDPVLRLSPAEVVLQAA